MNPLEVGIKDEGCNAEHQGLWVRGEKLTVKKFIKEENVDLLGLVENKQSDISMRNIRKTWGNQNVEWVYYPVMSGSGGVLVSWNKDVFEDVSSRVSVFGQFVPESFTCVVCVLYAPNDQRDRRELWHRLKESTQHLAIPLLLMGDYNEVL